MKEYLGISDLERDLKSSIKDRDADAEEYARLFSNHAKASQDLEKHLEEYMDLLNGHTNAIQRISEVLDKAGVSRNFEPVHTVVSFRQKRAELEARARKSIEPAVAPVQEEGN